MHWSRTRRAAVTTVAVALAVTGSWSATASAAPVTPDPAPATPGFDGNVHAIAKRGSTVYVGGEFQTVTDSAGQTFVRRGAAAFNSRTGAVLPWDPDVSGTVYALAVAKEGVYLGGEFSSVHGQARQNLARVSRKDTGDLHKLATGVDGAVVTLALTRKRVYLGGRFSAVGGRSRDAAAALRRSGNQQVTRWNPDVTGGSVNEIALLNGAVLVGGNFTKVSGDASAASLAKVSRERGTLMPGFNPGISAPVLDIAVVGPRAYVAAGGAGGGFVAAYRRVSGKQSWLKRFDGDVAAIAASKRTLYVGGHFDEFCKTPNTAQSNGNCLDGGIGRSKLAALRLDGRLRGWNPGTNSVLGVLAITAKPSRPWVAVGGAFTEVAGEPHARFALFD